MRLDGKTLATRHGGNVVNARDGTAHCRQHAVAGTQSGLCDGRAAAARR